MFKACRTLASGPGTRRGIATLSNNPHIYVHPQQDSTSILSLLPHTPPNPHLAIGSTTTVPPTPDSLTTNPHFLPVLHEVIARHARTDPSIIAQAQTYASTAGSSLGSGGALFPPNHPSQTGRRRKSARGDGAGGASSQGGMGGAGRGGHIHVSDSRCPPDYGRIAWPEDIFGSLEVDGRGELVDGTGRYQQSGTYRVVTREGILGLSDHMRTKLVARLEELGQSLNRA